MRSVQLYRWRRQRGHGTRLQQPQLPLRVRPFDVLRAPEVLGDFDAQPGQICQHCVGQLLNVGRLARLMADSTTRNAADDHLAAARPVVPNQTAAVELIVIRCHQAGNHGLAEPARCVDHDRLAIATDRVGGEHHTCDFGVDHALYDDRDSDVCGIDLDPAAVGDGALGPE